MFAYCLNSPVNRADYSGNISRERLSPNKSLLAEGMGGAIAVVLVGSMVAGNEIDQTSVNRLVDEIKEIFDFAKPASSTEGRLTDIALKHGEGYCDTAAKDMERYLKKKGEDYKVLTLVDVYGSGLIYSFSRGINVATNGYHMGVLYKGNVYCTIHPYGKPLPLWKADFEGECGPLQLIPWV